MKMDKEVKNQRTRGHHRSPGWLRGLLATALVGLTLGTGVLARATIAQYNVVDSFDADEIASPYEPFGPDPYGYGPRANAGKNDPGGPANAESLSYTGTPTGAPILHDAVQ